MSGETGPLAFDTSVAHSARAHDYWLGGKQWRPQTELKAQARSAMWGGVARKA